MSSLCRGHTDLPCIIPVLVHVLRAKTSTELGILNIFIFTGFEKLHLLEKLWAKTVISSLTPEPILLTLRLWLITNRTNIIFLFQNLLNYFYAFTFPYELYCDSDLNNIYIYLGRMDMFIIMDLNKIKWYVSISWGSLYPAEFYFLNIDLEYFFLQLIHRYYFLCGFKKNVFRNNFKVTEGCKSSTKNS